MTCDNFIEPNELSVNGRDFLISRIPAFSAKVVYDELIDKLRDEGDLGKTRLSERSVREILKFVGVKSDVGNYIAIDSNAVIDKYLGNYFDLLTVQVKMVDYNFSFLTDGNLRNLLGVPAEAEAESV